MASGSRVGVIKLWRVDQNYQLDATLAEHSPHISGLVFDDNSTNLLSSDGEGNVFCWHLGTRKCVAIYSNPGCEATPKKLVLSRDRSRIALRITDQALCFWDRRDPTVYELRQEPLLPCLKIGQDPHSDIELKHADDNDLLAKPVTSHEICERFGVSGWEMTPQFDYFTSVPRRDQFVLTCTADGRYFVCQAVKDRALLLVETPPVLFWCSCLLGHVTLQSQPETIAEQISCLGLSEDGSLLFVAQPDQGIGDPQITAWSTLTGTYQFTLTSSPGYDFCSISPIPGTRLVAGYFDSGLVVWDLDTQIEHSFKSRSMRACTSKRAVLSADGLTIVYGEGRELVAVHVNARKFEQSHKGAFGHSIPSFEEFAISPDAKVVAASITGPFESIGLQLWDVARGKKIGCRYAITQTSPEVEFRNVPRVVYSPDGKSIVTAGPDQYIRVWNAAGPELKHVLKGHTGSVSAALYSPDGRYLISGSSDASIRIWDAMTGECQAVIPNADQIHFLELSHDGSTLATATADHSLVRIWKLELNEDSTNTSRVSLRLERIIGRSQRTDIRGDFEGAVLDHKLSNVRRAHSQAYCARPWESYYVDSIDEAKWFHHDFSEEELHLFRATLQRSVRPSLTYSARAEAAYQQGLSLAAKGNLKAAARCFERATSLSGHPQAYARLASRYNVDCPHSSAASDGYRYALHSAKGRCTEGMVILARCYENGFGVPQNQKQAASWFLEAARRGNAEAMFRLGLCYMHGAGVQHDSARGSRLIKSAVRADHNNPELQYLLGTLYTTGAPGFERSPTQAFEWYLKATQRGYAKAQARVGLAFLDGIGVEKNQQLALEWMSKPVGQGSVDAALEMGRMYEEGIATEPDSGLAYECYSFAACETNIVGKMKTAHAVLFDPYFKGKLSKPELNDLMFDAESCKVPLAMTLLGIWYAHGVDVKPNVKEALHWLHKSAKLGDALGQFELGVAYLAEKGVKRNVKLGWEWINKALAQNEPKILCKLGDLFKEGHGVEPNATQAFQWYSKAAQCSYARGMYEVGYAYLHGLGVDQDCKQGLEFMSQAAQRGHADAQYVMAQLNEEGCLVDQNMRHAFEWYVKAARQEHAEAQKRVGVFYLTGIGIQCDENCGFAWLKLGSMQKTKQKEGRADNSFVHLALCYLRGMGVEPDRTLAVRMLRKVVNQASSQTCSMYCTAMLFLGICELNGLGGLEADEKIGMDRITEAVNGDDPEALYQLAELCREGTWYPKDLTKAFNCYTRAAAQGHTLAEYALGVAYSDGIGIESNPKLGLDWLSRAAAKNHVLAQKTLAEYYQPGGRGRVVDTEKADYWSRRAMQCSATPPTYTPIYAASVHDFSVHDSDHCENDGALFETDRKLPVKDCRDGEDPDFPD